MGLMGITAVIEMDSDTITGSNQTAGRKTAGQKAFLRLVSRVMDPKMSKSSKLFDLGRGVQISRILRTKPLRWRFTHLLLE